MGLFSIFKKKEPALDGFSKKFEPQLINLLKNDHALLAGLLNELRSAAAKKDASAFKLILGSFSTALKNHLIIENIKFYSYIEEKYSDDDEKRRHIHTCRVEMESIAVVINRFVTTYNKESLGAADWELTVPDIDNLITLLSRRIEKEESSLYSLYKN